MRLRSLALPVVLASVAAVVAPTPGSARSPASEQCALVMPTKVVISATTVERPVGLGANCAANGAEQASWDLVHSRGTVASLDWYAEDFAEGISSGYLQWYDDDPMGRQFTLPAGALTADGRELTQNTSVTLVKYAARITTKVTRTRTKLTWAATAIQWSGRKHGWNTRARVNIGLFHQPPGSTTWKYVKSGRTTNAGKATVTMNHPKSGSYRLVVGETPTVWAGYSSTIRGRV